MAYDFQYGNVAAASPQFTLNGGTPVYGYNSLNQYGLPSGTFGSNVPDLGGTIGTTQGLAGSTPQAPALGGLGLNLPTLQLGLQGLGTAANLYSGIKALGLARDQFSFQKAMADKNYANSVTSYNTSLEDRANARASVTGQSSADTQAYINAHKLN